MKSKILVAFIFSLLGLSVNSNAEITRDNNFLQSDAHHEIKLINHGLASLHERLELIRLAQKTIDVEYFIYNQDDSGKIITDALIKKAQSGVKVRILLDGMLGKYTINEFIAHELISLGVEIKYYNPISLLKGIKNKFRNHRKNLIIDKKIVLTGGRNIGNEYFDLGKKFSFLDREIIIQGELISEMVSSFEDMWRSEFSIVPIAPQSPIENRNGEFDLATEEYKSNLEKAQKFVNGELNTKFLNYISTVGSRVSAESLQTSCQNLKFITEKPIANQSVKGNRVINDYLHSKILSSTKSILMETPYFTFNHKDEAILNAALNNFVQITMLTNGANSTDVKISVVAIEKILKKWVNKGILFALFKGQAPVQYELTSGMNEKAFLGIHAKTYIFDRKDIIIGTYNYDFFSAKNNDELIIECVNAPESFISAVENDINQRIELSHKLLNEEQVDEISDNSLSGVFYKIIGDNFYDTAVN